MDIHQLTENDLRLMKIKAEIFDLNLESNKIRLKLKEKIEELNLVQGEGKNYVNGRLA